MERPTQKELVLNHLKNNGFITTYESYEKYGITRLAQMIRLLRQDGFNIENKHIVKLNRWGYKVTYDEYWLKDGD